MCSGGGVECGSQVNSVVVRLASHTHIVLCLLWLVHIALPLFLNVVCALVLFAVVFCRDNVSVIK